MCTLDGVRATNEGTKLHRGRHVLKAADVWLVFFIDEVLIQVLVMSRLADWSSSWSLLSLLMLILRLLEG